MMDIAVIKSRISCRDLLRQEGKQHPQNGNGVCPICNHGENTPCFGLYRNNSAFKCFSCGCSGDVVSLYEAIHSVDFKQAVKALEGRAGL